MTNSLVAELQANLMANGFSVEVRDEDYEMKDKHYWILEIGRGGLKGGLYLNHEVTAESLPLIVSEYDSRYPE